MKFTGFIEFFVHRGRLYVQTNSAHSRARQGGDEFGRGKSTTLLLGKIQKRGFGCRRNEAELKPRKAQITTLRARLHSVNGKFGSTSSGRVKDTIRYSLFAQKSGVTGVRSEHWSCRHKIQSLKLSLLQDAQSRRRLRRYESLCGKTHI